MNEIENRPPAGRPGGGGDGAGAVARGGRRHAGGLVRRSYSGDQAADGQRRFASVQAKPLARDSAALLRRRRVRLRALALGEVGELVVARARCCRRQRGFVPLQPALAAAGWLAAGWLAGDGEVLEGQA